MVASSYAEHLGAFVSTSSPAELPDEVRCKAMRHILDTFGAALAGATSEEACTVRAMLQASEESGPAPAWGTRLAFSPRSAALLNGIAAHAFELDDTGGCDHSGAVVLPAAVAALSFAEAPLRGEEFLLAVVLGYDIARRVLEACGGYQAHNAAGWHSTGTCGVFGAAAAACRVLQLDAQRATAALGLCGSLAGGLWAFIHDGSQAKRIHAGRAAEGGLLAALLARQGVSGPRQVFDAAWGGFLPTFGHGPTDAGALVQDLGTSWRISRCAIKPYASCRGTHSAIDAVGRILEQGRLRAGDVARVELRASAFLQAMCGGRNVSTLAAAQMSLPYAVAARVLLGHGDLSAYAPMYREDPALLAVMAAVSLEVDAHMAPDEQPIVTLHARDGRCFKERVTAPLGGPDNPLGDDRLEAKFMGLAGLVLSERQAVRLRDAVLRLDTLDDTRALLPLLTPARDRGRQARPISSVA